MCDQIQTPLTIVYFLTLHEISPIICKYLGKNVWLPPSLTPHSLLPQAYFGPRNTSAPIILRPGAYFGPEILWPQTTLAQYTSARGRVCMGPKWVWGQTGCEPRLKNNYARNFFYVTTDWSNLHIYWKQHVLNRGFTVFCSTYFIE